VDSLISRLSLGSASSHAATLDEPVGVASLLPPCWTTTFCPRPPASAVWPAGGARVVLGRGALATLGALATHGAGPTPVLRVGVRRCGRGHSSRDASAAIATRGGVTALLAACAGGTPAALAAAAGVLRNFMAFLDLLPSFRDEAALALLLQMVSLGTPRAQELAPLASRTSPPATATRANASRSKLFQEGVRQETLALAVATSRALRGRERRARTRP